MGGNRFQYIHYTADCEREATLFGKKKTALGKIDGCELWNNADNNWLFNEAEIAWLGCLTLTRYVIIPPA